MEDRSATRVDASIAPSRAQVMPCVSLAGRLRQIMKLRVVGYAQSSLGRLRHHMVSRVGPLALSTTVEGRVWGDA